MSQNFGNFTHIQNTKIGNKMKYFLDTEFIERPGSIQLISIGIVAEDGREYYAVSSEYNYDDASDWVKENVIEPIYDNYIRIVREYNLQKHIGLPLCDWTVDTFHKKSGMSINDETAWMGRTIKKEILDFIGKDKRPRFYGYYSAYDWVVFCQIFGTMMDLPEHFPRYCKDLKQMVSDLRIDTESIPFKPEQEHNALSDAKWTKQLYEYLNHMDKWG